MLDFFKANVGKRASEISPSPLGRWLDGMIVEALENALTVEFTVRKEMTNPLGILHGGTAASMMDDVMGMTVFSLGKNDPYVTVNLAIDYLRSAKVGEKVYAKSHVVRAGNTVIYITCELLNEEGKILARCTSNMVKVAMEKPKINH